MCVCVSFISFFNPLNFKSKCVNNISCYFLLHSCDYHEMHSSAVNLVFVFKSKKTMCTAIALLIAGSSETMHREDVHRSKTHTVIGFMVS